MGIPIAKATTHVGVGEDIYASLQPFAQAPRNLQ